MSASVLSVNAEVVQTSEFGTFSYWTPTGSNYVDAYTSISNSTLDNTIYVVAEMQDYVTGVTLVENGDSSRVEGCVDTTVYKPTGAGTTITYTCHEARGYGSIARYKANVL
jgi:hypothetical protein